MSAAGRNTGTRWYWPEPASSRTNSDPPVCAGFRHLRDLRLSSFPTRVSRLTDLDFLSKVKKLGREAGSNSRIATAHFFRLPRLGGRTIGSTSASGADYPGSSPGLPAKLFQSIPGYRRATELFTGNPYPASHIAQLCSEDPFAGTQESVV